MYTRTLRTSLVVGDPHGMTRTELTNKETKRRVAAYRHKTVKRELQAQLLKFANIVIRGQPTAEEIEDAKQVVEKFVPCTAPANSNRDESEGDARETDPAEDD